MTIGMIGLGHMGGSMARRLLDNGQSAVGFDISAASLEGFAKAGGKAANCPRDVADEAEIVLACLPEKHASLATAFGPDGVVHGRRIEIYVEMSTLGRATVLEIANGFADSQIGFVDAPISGGPKGALSGTLTAIMSGKRDHLERLTRIFELLTTNMFVVGDEPGMAQVCKLVNNILSITAFVTTCEAVSMGVKAGLDAHTMIDVVNVSTGRNSATMDKFPKAVLPRTFDYGGPLSIGVKDVELYLELARDTHMPAFVGANVANLFHHIADRLGHEADYSRMVTVFEEWGGITVGGGKPAVD